MISLLSIVVDVVAQVLIDLSVDGEDLVALHHKLLGKLLRKAGAAAVCVKTDTMHQQQLTGSQQQSLTAEFVCCMYLLVDWNPIGMEPASLAAKVAHDFLALRDAALARHD